MGFDVLPTGIATGVPGSLFATQVVQAIAGGQAFVVPAGFFYFYAVGANTQLQVQDGTGTWQTVTGNGVGGLVGSDGANVRYFNAAGGGQTVTFIKAG